LVRMQRLKTGAMIAFSGEAGAILAQADEQVRSAIRMFAQDLGLAFQITDDLLDVRGSQDETGKKVRKDAAAGKSTFVSLLGPEGAAYRAHMLAEQATMHLEMFGEKA